MFKKYCNKETGAIVEMQLTPTGRVKFWLPQRKQAPTVWSAKRFYEFFEEVRDA